MRTRVIHFSLLLFSICLFAGPALRARNVDSIQENQRNTFSVNFLEQYARIALPVRGTVPFQQYTHTNKSIVFSSKPFSVAVNCFFQEQSEWKPLSAVSQAVWPISHRGQVDTILQRYCFWMLHTYPRADIASLINSYDPVHQWPDIYYEDMQPANWQVAQHLKRLTDLALAWVDSTSGYYHNAKVWQVIRASLDHWLHKRYRSVNWWHNKIGVPQAMRDIVVLIKDSLEEQKFKSALEVIAQYGSWHTHTGANLVWSADLALHYGALTGNDSIMNTAASALVDEIKISTGEGIQYDFSFHQHDRRLQIYHYGRAFLWDHIRLAWQLRNTQWQYPEAKIAVFSDFILKGWQWMARGIHTVPGTLDRAVSRPGALRHADIRKLIPYLAELDSTHANDWKVLNAWQNGHYNSVSDFRYYPYSDFAVYHTKDFSFFLKTTSTRTLPAESINNENLRGKLMHSGDAYFIRDGEEYFDLMPVWDWESLPGVTTFTHASGIVRSDFAGSVSDNESGATAMDYCLQNNNGGFISAKKAWFCHNGQVICLIGGLKRNNLDENVVTALDQSRWRGPVAVNGKKITDPGLYSEKTAKWLHHAGIGYVFLKPETVSLHLDTVSDSWRSVNASASKALVTAKLFKPVLQHKADTVIEGTGYVLAPCKTPAEAAAHYKNRSWVVVQNDSLCQAVVWKDGTAMLAFYGEGKVTLNKKMTVAVNRPVLLLIKKDVLYASDPAHTGNTLCVKINDKPILLSLSEKGFTVSAQIPGGGDQ